MSGPPAESRFMNETGAAARIAALAEPVLESLGYRLVLTRILQGQGMVLEILAERPDGSMTIDDCRVVSNALSPVLDVHDPIAASYRLQISSPGIDRPLVRPADFDRWAGFEARVSLKEMIDGRRRFRGILEGFEDGEVRIEVDLGKDQGSVLIGLPLALVEEAKLVLTDELVRESLRRSKRLLTELEGSQEPAEGETWNDQPAASEAVKGAVAGKTGTTGAAGTKAIGKRESRKPDRRRQRGDLA